MLFPSTTICGTEVLVCRTVLSLVSDIHVGISETWMSKSSCRESFLILVVNYCTVDIKHQNWHQSNYVLQGCGETRHSWNSFFFPLLLIVPVYQICCRKVLTCFYTCVYNIFFCFVEGLNVIIRFKTRMKCFMIFSIYSSR